METPLSVPLIQTRRPARAARSPLALYGRMVKSSGAVEVREAFGPAGFEATQRIRHAVYCKEKKFLDEGSLLDQWDDRAVVLNAYRGEEAVGTCRVTDSADGALEIFDMHPELQALVPAGARLLEVSRLNVLRGHRGFSVTLPLFRRVFQELVKRKAQGLILSCAPALIPYYRDLLGCRQLSRKPLHHARLRGLIDYPMIMEWPRVLERATPSALPFWFAINPLWCLRAMLQTGLRAVRESLPGFSSILDSSIP